MKYTLEFVSALAVPRPCRTISTEKMFSHRLAQREAAIETRMKKEQGSGGRGIMGRGIARRLFEISSR